MSAISRLVVSVHDVSPATAVQSRRWCADLDARGIPAALLVVPGPWRSPALHEDPDFAGWLLARAHSGDELVQHGWAHRPPGTVHNGLLAYVVARGAAEFAALSEGQAAARLLAGRARLTAAGLHAPGFTPPGWLASPGTLRALAQLGYRYTTNHTALLDLRTGRRLPALALSHRPGGLGEHTGARLMTTLSGRAARRGRDIRIALHPDDLHRPGLRAATLRAIDGCLALGATPTTYLRLLADPVEGPR